MMIWMSWLDLAVVLVIEQRVEWVLVSDKFLLKGTVSSKKAPRLFYGGIRNLFIVFQRNTYSITPWGRIETVVGVRYQIHLINVFYYSLCCYDLTFTNIKFANLHVQLFIHTTHISLFYVVIT